MAANDLTPTLLGLTLAIFTLAACATSPQPARDDTRVACPGPRQLSRALDDIDGHFDRALAESNQDLALARTHALFSELRDKSDLTGQTLCAPELPVESRRAGILCLDQRLAALEQIDALLVGAEAGLQPEQIQWRLDAKVDWLAATVRCQTEAMSTNRGAEATHKEALSLGAPLRLEASLVCERQTAPDTFEALERCNGASLKQGDRFKISVNTSTPAHLYFYLYNGSGQFQVFFPDKGIDNKTTAETDYALPDRGWMTLDQVGGVLEHVLVVASLDPIEELEALRGANIPPTREGDVAPSARRIRGIIEPLVTRGANLEQGAPVALGALGGRVGVPVVATNARQVALEYEIFHVHARGVSP